MQFFRVILSLVAIYRVAGNTHIGYELSKTEVAEFEQYYNETLSPKIESMEPLTACAINVTWSCNECKDVEYFEIMYNLTYGGMIPNDVFNYTMTRLDPDTLYEAHVISVYVNYTQYLSNSSYATTYRSDPPDIDYIEVYDVTDTTIWFRWNTSSTECPIERYDIVYNGTMMCDEGRNDSGSTYTTLTDTFLYYLLPYTNYSIVVSGVTLDEVDGRDGVLPGVMTDPGSITSLEAYNITDTRMQLSWNITGDECAVKEYHIGWNGQTICVSGKYDSGIDISFQKDYTLFELTPYTDYSVNVYAISPEDVSGATTALHDLNTQEGEPGPPNSVTSTTLTSTSVRIKWNPPLECNGILLDYKVSWRHSSSATIIGSARTPVTIMDILDLEACTDYEFLVQGSTVAGDGKTASTTTITLPEQPSPMTNLTVGNTTSRSTNLTWVPPDTNCPVLYYPLGGKGSVLWESLNVTFDIVVPGGISSYIVEDLIPWTNYSLCMLPVMEGGMSVPICSDTQTLQDVPSEPMLSAAMLYSNTEVQLLWDPPEALNGELLYYNVSWEAEGVEVLFETTTKTNLFIEDMVPCLVYDLGVKGATVIGEGNKSSMSVLMDVIAPPPPMITLCETLDSTSIALEWGPSESQCSVLNYSVSTDGIILWNGSNVLSTEYTQDLNIILTELIPYTNYALRVQASTQAGYGEPNLCAQITEEDVPSQPLNLRSRTLTSKEVLLQWDPPEALNGILSSYNVTWESEGNGISSQTTTDTDLLLSDLVTCSNYVVNVRGVTGAGQGDPATINVTTSTEAPSPANIIQCEATGSRTIELQWEASDTSCQVTYDVTANGTILWNGTKTYSSTSTEELNIVLTDLVPYTEYILSVTPDTVGGQGQPNFCGQTTEEEVPGAPTDLSVAEGSVTSSSFSILWKEPAEKNGILKGFNASLDNGNSQYLLYTKPGDIYTAEFNGLQPDTQYFISVFAENGAGYGEPSETTVQTLSMRRLWSA